MKCIYIIGPESSGSVLVAKIVAHNLGIADYGTWNGFGIIKDTKNKVIHRSLPYGKESIYPDIDSLYEKNRVFQQLFILTTRDNKISKISKMERFKKTKQTVNKENNKAKSIFLHIMDTYKFFLFSYETFMFLGKPYLNQLNKWVGTDKFFCPELIDGNEKRIKW